jgi:hypothetical protein
MMAMKSLMLIESPSSVVVAHVQYPQEDLQSMVGLLRLLLQKEQCIAQLRDMNNKAESVLGPSPIRHHRKRCSSFASHDI